jgi:hypothetical protein
MVIMLLFYFFTHTHLGRRNYRFFFQFLSFLCLHMSTVFACCLLVCLKSTDFKSIQTITSISLLILIFVLIFPIGGLLVFHLVLVSNGRTTNEHVTGKYRGNDFFDRGLCTNFIYLFCGSLTPQLKTVQLNKNKDTNNCKNGESTKSKSKSSIQKGVNLYMSEKNVNSSSNLNKNIESGSVQNDSDNNPKKNANKQTSSAASIKTSNRMASVGSSSLGGVVGEYGVNNGNGNVASDVNSNVIGSGLSNISMRGSLSNMTSDNEAIVNNEKMSTSPARGTDAVVVQEQELLDIILNNKKSLIKNNRKSSITSDSSASSSMLNSKANKNNNRSFLENSLNNYIGGNINATMTTTMLNNLTIKLPSTPQPLQTKSSQLAKPTTPSNTPKSSALIAATTAYSFASSKTPSSTHRLK